MKKLIPLFVLTAAILTACPPPPVQPVLKSVLITCTSSSIAVGATTTCTAVGKDAAGVDLVPQPTLTMNSSQPSNATISSAGMVTGVTVGSTTIGLLNAPVGVAVTVFSITVTAPVVAPADPTNLAATVVSTSAINLSWTASSGATSYLIDRKTGSAGFVGIVQLVGANSFNDTGLTANTIYTYRVRASGSGGLSSGIEVTATTQAAVAAPANPTNLAATVISSSRIDLSWVAASGATGYTVERKTGAATYANVATVGSGTSFFDTSLTASTTYMYRVKSVNGAGGSSGGVEVTATTQALTPVAVKKTIAGGVDFSLALKTDGTVLSWGSDTYGALGDDVPIAAKNTPVAVAGLTNVVAIASGSGHSLVLKQDGTVMAWGRDTNGQLGDDAAIANKSTPVPVAGLTNIVAIAAGGFHSLALKQDGTVMAWGYDGEGELGNDAATVNQPTPVAVAGVSNVVAIAAGAFHSLALKQDGTLVAWGFDGSGQVGDGANTDNKTTFVSVLNATNIIAIAGGEQHSLALRSDGTMLAWGADNFGQLGDDASQANKDSPVVVPSATGITAIAAGDYHSLAVKTDKTVLAWGNDDYGQLGDGASLAFKPLPAPVSGASNVVSVMAGDFHSLALKEDGTMLAWGRDATGQLGDDATTADKPTAVSVLLGAFTIRLP